MRIVCRLVFLLALPFLLSGCIPALYVHLYNATGEVITLTKSQSKEVVTIPVSTAADFSPVFVSGEKLVIRTPKHLWTYSLRDVFVPQSLLEQHLGVLRGYARIDSRGYIYALAPPIGTEPPHEIRQPHGFPVPPRNKT